jgi:type II secretory pathway pseudopilin PulG
MLVVGAGISVALLLLALRLNSERWTNPAAELRQLLAYYGDVEARQKQYYAEKGRYATALSDLAAVDFSRRPRVRITSECQDAYCFDLSANNSGYVIRITPDPRALPGQRRQWSLYSDEKGSVRVSFGSKFANAQSAVLSQREMETFGPR